MGISIDRENTCCFTGHREMSVAITDHLFNRVKDGINYLYSHDVKTYLTGGAIGFDTLAAKAVIERRSIYPDIKLILVIPCRDQTRAWRQADIEAYENIKELADKVICLSENYYSGCMHRRNRYLVDNSSACICYLTRTSGGTAYTVRYARDKGLSIFNLAQGRKA